jgi:hypothetical protein
LAGRVSHPLDDTQSFMKVSPPPIPFDQPCLVALNFLSAVRPHRGLCLVPPLPPPGDDARNGENVCGAGLPGHEDQDRAEPLRPERRSEPGQGHPPGSRRPRHPNGPYRRERVTRPYLRGCASLYPFGTGTLSRKWPENRSFVLQNMEKRPVPADSGKFPFAPGETVTTYETRQ